MNAKGRIVSLGGSSFPFFYETLRPSDSLAVLRQMRGHKFDASLILGIADRCRFNCPRVIVCSPLNIKAQGNRPRSAPGSPSLAPFPTSFWLTCPWLARFVGTIESGGGVGELERWIERRALDEWIPFNIEHQRIRLALLPEAAVNFLRRFMPQVFQRLRGGGVGGIRYDTQTRQVRVKCIHLQVASWLALGRHPGGPWLEGQNAGQDCGGGMKNFCWRERGTGYVERAF